jgi:hypothetical protein
VILGRGQRHHVESVLPPIQLAQNRTKLARHTVITTPQRQALQLYTLQSFVVAMGTEIETQTLLSTSCFWCRMLFPPKSDVEISEYTIGGGGTDAALLGDLFFLPLNRPSSRFCTLHTIQTVYSAPWQLNH